MNQSQQITSVGLSCVTGIVSRRHIMNGEKGLSMELDRQNGGCETIATDPSRLASDFAYVGACN